MVFALFGTSGTRCKGNMVTGIVGTCANIEGSWLQGLHGLCPAHTIDGSSNLLDVLTAMLLDQRWQSALRGGLGAATWCYLGSCLTRSPAWPLEILRGWMLHPSTGDGVRS